MYRLVLIAIGLLLLPAVSRADQIESFDSSNSGWLIVSYPFRSHVANPGTQPAVFDGTFGNPAGSVRFDDVYGETGAAAPAAWLGDRSAYYGGSLAYDIYIRFVDPDATYPAVVLNGGTNSVYYDAPAPPVDEWESRTVPLTESGWRVAGAQTPVDEATFRAVLADLHGIYIYTEWRTGPDDTSLDNVRLIGSTVGAPESVPPVARLRGASPNPFNPRTTVRFTLARAAAVRLAVYEVSGRRVRVLAEGSREAGDHDVIWDGRDDRGRVLPSGSYVCRLEAGAQSAAAIVILLK